MINPEQTKTTDESEMTMVILSVGSNCGDRHLQVSSGIKWLASILTDARASAIYTTGDCHGGIRDYMNAVVCGMTELGIEKLDRQCKEYELTQGRTAEVRARGDVPVDIDIVVYDEEILRPKDYRQEFFRIGLAQLS